MPSTARAWFSAAIASLVQVVPVGEDEQALLFGLGEKAMFELMLIVGGLAGLRAAAAVVGPTAAFAAGADVDSAATPPEVAGVLAVGVAGFVADPLVPAEPAGPVLPVRPIARPGALLPTPWPDPAADSDESAFAADCDSARPSSSWTVA
jgi:hypothetical protein